MITLEVLELSLKLLPVLALCGVSHAQTTLQPEFFMAPAPQSLKAVSGLSHFPQLFLAVSIASLLLLILFVIVCASCRRLSGRVRKGASSQEEHLKVVYLKKQSVLVRPEDDPYRINTNGVILSTIVQQTGNVGDESQNAQRIPNIPLASPVEIEDGSGDSLYEVVKDVPVNTWMSEQVSPEQQSPESTIPYEEMVSTEPRGMDGCSNENKESMEGAPIYAKVVKQRNKECQPQIQEKPEATVEGAMDEPPPVPDKHLDDEDAAQ
ncbi:uncharacterized protein [Heptranchias perlo]|uniref:uncharacterized protein n=1 Tax=Heptranchias perlo TaxID=212740 RepID=UPI00355A78E9